jgi:hypothetical protein
MKTQTLFTGLKIRSGSIGFIAIAPKTLRLNANFRKFTLEIDGKQIAAELFRHTNKALTITGYTLDPVIRELQNVDKVFDWALVWGNAAKLQLR